LKEDPFRTGEYNRNRAFGTTNFPFKKSEKTGGISTDARGNLAEAPSIQIRPFRKSSWGVNAKKEGRKLSAKALPLYALERDSACGKGGDRKKAHILDHEKNRCFFGDATLRYTLIFTYIFNRASPLGIGKRKQARTSHNEG